MFDNEFEFCQKLAVAILHSRFIKSIVNKNTHTQQKYVDRKIQIVVEILVSMLTRNVAHKLLQQCLNGDMQRFVDFCVLVVKNPPILDQVDLNNFGKKTHAMHYKHVVASEHGKQSQPQTDEGHAYSCHGIVKEYYNLYRSKILIENLRKFRSDLRCRLRNNNNALKAADEDMDSMSDVSSGESSGDDDDDESEEEEEEDDELLKHTPQRPTKQGIFTLFNSLFSVQCVDWCRDFFIY